MFTTCNNARTSGRSLGPDRCLMFLALTAVFLSTAGAPVHAVDGLIEINHAKALAGGVSPGDLGGYPVTIDAPGSYILTGDLNAPGRAWRRSSSTRRRSRWT